MIQAFRVNGVFHAMRSERESTVTIRQGVEGILTRFWWVELCSAPLTQSEGVAPSAPITCSDCREVLFGPN